MILYIYCTTNSSAFSIQLPEGSLFGIPEGRETRYLCHRYGKKIYMVVGLNLKYEAKGQRNIVKPIWSFFRFICHLPMA